MDNGIDGKCAMAENGWWWWLKKMDGSNDGAWTIENEQPALTKGMRDQQWKEERSFGGNKRQTTEVTQNIV